MLFVVVQIGILALVGTAWLWLAAREARARREREALARALRELAAGLGGSMEEEALLAEVGGQRFSARLAREAGAADALVIALPLDEAGTEPVEPAGYRASAMRRVNGRPWLGFSPHERWGPAGHGNRTMQTWRSPTEPEAERLLDAPGLREAVEGLFDAGVEWVDVNDGAAAIEAWVPAVRAEQINAFAFREIAGGLGEAARALPAFEGAAAPRPPRRLAAALAWIVPATVLAVTAPFVLLDALEAWPPFEPWIRLSAVGGGAGIAAWGAILLGLRRSAGGRAPASGAARTALAMLLAALVADGAALAVGLNAWLGHPAEPMRTADVVWRVVGWPFGERFEVAVPRPDTEAVDRATLTPRMMAQHGALTCAGKVGVAVWEGWLGVSWVDHVWCVEPLHVPSPPEDAPEEAPFAIFPSGGGGTETPPPLRFFDVHLRNDAKEPRWFLFSDLLGVPLSWEEPATWVEVQDLGHHLGDVGHVPVVRVQATGMQAVRLPAKGRVVIVRLAMDYQPQAGRQITDVEVVVARSLRWGGRALEYLVEGGLLASSDAVVEDCGGDPICRPIALPSATGLGPAPVTYEAVGVLRARLFDAAPPR